MNDELARLIVESAGRLGAKPEDLATVFSFETGGKLDPEIWGGAGGRHFGLIQAGPSERERYGIKPGQSLSEHMAGVERYLVDRGFKPGMGLLDLYSTINAGRPGLYDRSDAANGGTWGTVRDKVESQFGPHRARAAALLGTAPVAPMAAEKTAMVPSMGGISGAADIDPSILKALQGIAKAAQPQEPEQDDDFGALGFSLGTPPGIARLRAQLMQRIRR